MAVKKSLKNLKFDEALAMLEEKVKLLEEGNLPLEESLEVFKEGIELSKICTVRNILSRSWPILTTTKSIARITRISRTTKPK